MKKEILSLSVERREQVGSKKIAILRSNGIVPGVLYGSGLGKAKSELIQVNAVELNKLYCEFL